MPALYFGKNMLRMHRLECQTEYEKSTPLKILTIENGIIHPLCVDVLSKMVSGGVTDDQARFIELSLTKRVSPKNFLCDFSDWYCGASAEFEPDTAEYIDEDVVFLGALPSHYGHFITEGLARLWPFLGRQFMDCRGAYISETENNRFNDLFHLFGLQNCNLLDIKTPTRFRTVIVPEQSIRLHDYYHLKYKETIDRISRSVEPAKYRKVFFSKAMSGNGRAVGELPIQSVFERNGFVIFFPEKLGMYETISILKGCDEFVATSGTNIHNSVFMNDEKAITCLSRSEHFHPLQTMIDRMKRFTATYVDVFVFSSNDNFGNAPCYVTTTNELSRYFLDRGFDFNKVHLTVVAPWYLIYYLMLLASRRMHSLHFAMKSSKFRSIRLVAMMLRRVKRFAVSSN